MKIKENYNTQGWYEFRKSGTASGSINTYNPLVVIWRYVPRTETILLPLNPIILFPRICLRIQDVHKNIYAECCKNLYRNAVEFFIIEKKENSLKCPTLGKWLNYYTLILWSTA